MEKKSDNSSNQNASANIFSENKVVPQDQEHQEGEDEYDFANLLKERLKQDMVTSIRKRNKKAQLNQLRNEKVQLLEAEGEIFLASIMNSLRDNKSEEPSEQDLNKLRRLTDLALEGPYDNIYQRHFLDNFDIGLIEYFTKHIHSLIIRLPTQHEKIPILFSYIEILSNMLLINEQKEQECVIIIHKLVLLPNLMRDILVCFSSYQMNQLDIIRKHVMLLCSTLARISSEVVIYIIESGWINIIQNLFYKEQLSCGFYMNCSMFFYYIIKRMQIIEVNPTKVLFCVKFNLTIIFESLELASQYSLKLLEDMAEFSCLGLIKAKELPIYYEIIMSDLLYSKIIFILNKFIGQSSDCNLEKMFSLLCQILKSGAQNAERHQSLLNCIEEKHNILILKELINKCIDFTNLKITNKVRKRALQILVHLVDLSPTVTATFSNSTLLLYLINQISNRAYRDEIVHFLHLFAVLGDNNLLKNVAKESQLAISVVNLIVNGEETSIEDKRALVDFLLILLKIGMEEVEYEGNNFVVYQIEMCGGESKLLDVFMNTQDKELQEKLEYILEKYFQSGI